MNDSMIAAGLALLLVGQPAVLAGQQQQQVRVAAASLPDAPTVQQAQQQQQQQQQGIPDAPKPQTTLGPVTPGKGTTVTSNGTSNSAAPDDQTIAPPSALQKEAAPAQPVNSQEFLKDDQTISVRVNAIEIPFTVKDNKGKLVPGLDWRDVVVYENGVRQHTTVFTTDPWPLTVAIVLDQSLPVQDMTRVNNALSALAGAFTPYDTVAVVSYNNGPKVMTGFTGGQTPRLVAAIEQSKTAGRDNVFYDTSGPMAHGILLNGGANSNETPLSSGGPGSPQGMSQTTAPREVHTLNDAVMTAAQLVAKAPKGQRRLVYVISDGKEYGSTAKQKDVIKYLQANKIEVVATLVGDSSVEGMGFVDGMHLPLMMRDNILPVYTKATGGEFYADYRTKGIETSFARITEEARTQYTIWYNSQEPMVDGKFRKVTVVVERPHLQVIAKDGYYPAATDFKPNGVRQLSTPAMAQDPSLPPVSSMPPAPAPQQ